MISLSSSYIFSKVSDQDFSRVAAQHAKSLKRLSAGTTTSDPMSMGGEAGLDLKYRNTSLSQKAVESGILNAKSYLELQSESLVHISSLLDRLGQLIISMKDSTKSAADLDTYLRDSASDQEAEFNLLRTEISATRQRQFNGNDLMYVAGNAAAQNLTVMLNERGDQTMDVTQTDFSTETLWQQFLGQPSNPVGTGDANAGSFYTTVSDLTDEVGGFGISGIAVLQEDLAKRLAQNASEQSRLNIALDHLRQNSFDYEQAGSRIFDTDVAQEVTNLARKDILMKGIISSRVQSNVLSEVALRVMGG